MAVEEHRHVIPSRRAAPPPADDPQRNKKEKHAGCKERSSDQQQQLLGRRMGPAVEVVQVWEAQERLGRISVVEAACSVGGTAAGGAACAVRICCEIPVDEEARFQEGR